MRLQSGDPGCRHSKCLGIVPLGGTSGRTTLNGEGLQHQDGHCQVVANTVPSLLSYDPAFGYELAVIIRDGIRHMYQEQEDLFYFITVHCEGLAAQHRPLGTGTLRRPRH